jgi:hypothetical protein
MVIIVTYLTQLSERLTYGFTRLIEVQYVPFSGYHDMYFTHDTYTFKLPILDNDDEFRRRIKRIMGRERLTRHAN